MSTTAAAQSPTIAEPEGWSGRALERAGDWFNPILVKEVRQSLKSRQFVLTFLLLLVGAWLVSFLSVMWGGDELEFGSLGSRVFWWYYFVLSVSMFVIVPFTAFRSLLAERDDNTFDLLSITTLAPKQIVRGKLLSAMVQLFIFYSAVTPFVAFTSMLKGFSWPEVLYVLVVSLLVSVLACMASLMVGTLAKTRTWQALLSIALLIGLIVLFSFFTLMEFPGSGRRQDPGLAGLLVAVGGELQQQPGFWWMTGIMLVMGLSYLILFQQIAISRMTFESDNHSTGVRVICYVQFLLAWLCISSIFLADWLGTLMDGWWLLDPVAAYLREVAASTSIPVRIYLRGVIPFFGAFTLIHFAFVGLFSSTETLELSRRLRRGLPRRRLFRILVAPWLPGGGRGYLYLLTCLASFWLVVAAQVCILDGAPPGEVVASMVDHDMSSWGREIQFITCGCCYVVVYCGIGLFLTRHVLPISGELRPSHVRIVTVLLALAGIIVPYLVRSFGVEALERYSLLLISVPFDTLDHVHSGREYADLASLTLLGAAAMAVLFNLPTILGGITELHTADPERLKRIDDARHVGDDKD